MDKSKKELDILESSLFHLKTAKRICRAYGSDVDETERLIKAEIASKKRAISKSQKDCKHTNWERGPHGQVHCLECGLWD